jgi:hypothetical protein
MTLNKREALALSDAAKRPGGWGLFFPKTTAKLAERGFFIKDIHRGYGMQWRITESGRAALQAAE